MTAVLWCPTCQQVETEPHPHKLERSQLIPEGAQFVKFGAPEYADTALWEDYEAIFEAGVLFTDKGQLVRNLGLFSSPRLVRRLLHFWHLTQLVVNVPGAWLEFGVLYGRDLAWWHCLKTLNPYQHSYTRIVGFDTWGGHVGTHAKDGSSKRVVEGEFATPPNYPQFLRYVLAVLEQNFAVGPSALLVEGDVRDTLPQWLVEYPDQAVAFAYLDLDLYEPTRFVLEQLADRMPKGAVVGFDEFGANSYPGEARAVAEVFGYNRALRRSPHGDWTYLVV